MKYNPNRVWVYNEGPSIEFPEGRGILTITEKEIVDQWYEHNKARVYKNYPEKVYTEMDCVWDFVCINWAWTEDESEEG